MNDKAYKFSTRDSTEFTVGDEGVQLPEVTADDNGDVLTVVEGTWAKAAPSGGALIVEISSEEIDGDIHYTFDKTAREIIAAMPLVYIGAQMDTPEIKGAQYMPVYMASPNDFLYTGWMYYESDTYDFSAGYNFMLNAGILLAIDPEMSEGDATCVFNAPTLDDYPTYIVAEASEPQA